MKRKPSRKKDGRGGRRPGAGRPKKAPLTGQDALVTELGAAKSARALFDFDKSIGAAVLSGTLPRLEAEAVLGASREARQALKVARAERAEKRVRALEILTPDEAEVLKKYRESIRPQPLKPGEYVKPPVIEGAAG